MAQTASSTSSSTTGGVQRRVVAAILLGTLLNPLNSSMIAVAIVHLERDFRVGVVSASWLISSYYLAGAVGQPVAGRLADQFGPRRLFCAGLAVIAVAGVFGALAPSFGWVVVARVVLAFGTSTAFPSGLAIIRRAAGGQPAPQTLGALSIAASVSAALGPVLGGGLVSLFGWEAIFAVNVVMVAIALPLALRWLPRDTQRGAREVPLATLRRLVDLPGIALFSGMLAALLALLLSLPTTPLWGLAPIAAAAAVGFAWWERRRAEPFLDVRMLVADRRLLSVYAQFAAVNVVFYGVFFSLPIWLESVRGYSPGAAGLIMLPIAGLGVVVTPLAARLIEARGPRPALVIGAAALTAGTLLLLFLGQTLPIVALLAIGAVLGIPSGFNNLGLQSALYAAAEPQRTGAAAGLFQTCRYIGSVFSTSLIGIVFAAGVTSGGMHTIAIALAAMSTAILLASLTRAAGVKPPPAASATSAAPAGRSRRRPPHRRRR